MGKYFIPPDPKDSMCETEGTDLTKRCVCRKCHETLEPLAAYFGAVAEAGSAVVNDLPVEYPDYNACKLVFPQASSSSWCNRLYIETAISAAGVARSSSVSGRPGSGRRTSDSLSRDRRSPGFGRRSVSRVASTGAAGDQRK